MASQIHWIASSLLILFFSFYFFLLLLPILCTNSLFNLFYSKQFSANRSQHRRNIIAPFSSALYNAQIISLLLYYFIFIYLAFDL